MNVRDRLIEICRENHEDVYGDVQPSSWENSADDILAEFMLFQRYTPEPNDHRGHRCSMDPNEKRA